MGKKGFRTDHSSQRFGRLVLLERLPDGPMNKARYQAKCDCGKELPVRFSELSKGDTRSCGCLHKEIVTKHGHSSSRTYRTWTSMHQRCGNPSATGYEYYGGRGITVCERWKTFEPFLADMGFQPAPRMSIDRIDVNGNYEPSNCRWLSMLKQQLNRRNNRRLTLNGRTQTAKEWRDELKMNKSLFQGRLGLGWSMEKIAQTPVQIQFRQLSNPKKKRSRVG